MKNSGKKSAGARRKLISKSEGTISWLQIIGFALVLAGILYLWIGVFFSWLEAADVALSFFIIMLGVAFAFPDMLKDENNHVSTMRIVVFMLINVICMLLLKIGWDKKSLEEIGLNGYWMGIIGFLFGAKVAQSFFESRLARSQRTTETITDEEMPTTVVEGNAKEAIDANRSKLMQQFPGIVRLTPSFRVDGSRRVPCVDIFIRESSKAGLPEQLEYLDTTGNKLQVPVRVIANYDNVKPQVGRGQPIANKHSKLFRGTAGCILESASSTQKFLLTCNHVMTAGHFENSSNADEKAVRVFSDRTYDDIGNWVSGRMDSLVDAAIIEIEITERIESNDVNEPIYLVSDDDCSFTEVELKGAYSDTQRAYIIHLNETIDVDYKNATVPMTGLITISTDLDHRNFTPPTQEGDSGSLVYHSSTRQPIGIVIGANSQFSFIVPIRTIFNAFSDLKLKFLSF